MYQNFHHEKFMVHGLGNVPTTLFASQIGASFARASRGFAQIGDGSSIATHNIKKGLA